MQLINVIPISRGINVESLTYFSASPLKKGSVVFVPLRGKEIPAIVLSSQDITDVKTKIKTADFALKKIVNKERYDILLPEFMSTAQKMADYFATTTGSVLNATIPRAIWGDLVKPNTIKTYSTATKKIQALKKNAISTKQIFQSEINDRLSNYKSLIREEFARKSSVFLLVPTMQDAVHIDAFLKKGIEQYTFVLHGKLTKKEILQRWNQALESIHPVLIIATGLFLSLPRNDVDTIIVERENSRAYKHLARPYLDIRVFAESYAHERGIRIIFSDLPLQVETMWRYYENELDEFSTVKQRTIRTAGQFTIDMKDKKHQKAGEFQVISDELKDFISNTLKNKKNIFIFVARRGISSSTICLDCGNVVSCLECGSPAVLHGTAKGNRFICHSCGALRSSDERCKTCASWKLKTLGIGIQLIEKSLYELFPKEKIITIDKDSTPTHKKATLAVERFYAHSGNILLGTEMALLYLNKEIDYSAIATIDSLFSLPEWRVSEKILSILLKIKEITINEMLIQTRKPDQKIFYVVEKGNLTNFYKDEIKKRKEFGYPPYNVFIKITVVGTENRVVKEMKYIKELLLKEYNIQIYPSSIKLPKGKYAMHGLLRIERDKWRIDHMQLIEILRSLPPYFSVNVGPESLL